MPNKAESIFKLLRPEQWVKNLFVWIPAFFAANLLEPGIAVKVFLGFLAFSLVASSVYCLNDWVDVEQDRQHPRKRFRPFASGALNAREVVLAGALSLIAGFALALLSQTTLWQILLAYIGINLLYSFAWKKRAIIDITLIAIGFLLRIFAGGIVAGVAISHWLIVLTFLLAMILGFSKRRGEFVRTDTETQLTRPALAGYSLPFIDGSIVFLSAVTVVAYLMYSLSEEVITRIDSPYLYFTTIFVILGILRYLQLTIVFNKTESPTRVLWTDLFLQLVLLGWIAAFGYLLYF